jgi:hypothetical protein
MVSNYLVLTYLLDKSHITYTITRMMLGFDAQNDSALIEDLYMPEVHLDYDPLLGGEPRTASSTEWTERLAEIHAHYDSTQHIVQ